MASIFARDLAGLTSAEIAQQQADTQQRAVDLAYLAQIANAGVTRAGDMGRERVGMRTTDNSRDVGMRSADVTDRGLTLRRESDLGQRDVERYRIDAESERSRQDNINRLATIIEQQKLQQAGIAAENALRRQDAQARAAAELKEQEVRSRVGQIDPGLLDILAGMEQADREAKETKLAQEAGTLTTEAKPGWWESWVKSDFEKANEVLKATPGGTNRFDVIKSATGKASIVPKPLPPIDRAKLLEMATRRSSGVGPAAPQGIDLNAIRDFLSGTNAPSGTSVLPVVKPAAAGPNKADVIRSAKLLPNGMRRLPSGMILLFDKNGAMQRAAPEDVGTLLTQDLFITDPTE